MQSIMNQRLELSVFLERIQVFKCGQCSSVFREQVHLDYHTLRHNKNLQLFDIAMNIMTFEAQVVLDRVPIYECSDCTRGFLSDWDYQRHKMRHYRQKLSMKLKAETQTKHSDDDVNDKYRKIHQCEECDAKFVLYSTLLAHSVLHKPFDHVCTCGIGYYKKKDLQIHKKLVHGATNPAKTQWKPKINLSLETIMRTKPRKPRARLTDLSKDNDKDETPEIELAKEHLNKENIRRFREAKQSVSYSEIISGQGSSKGPRLKATLVYKRKKIEKRTDTCNLCDLTLSSMDYIKHALLVHGCDRPYKCDECGNAFKTGGMLTKHKRKQHEEMKPPKIKPQYPCIVCNKILSCAYNFKNHMMLHTGEANHECDYCGKKFVALGSLNLHKETHGEKKYACPTCGKKFSHYSNMINHTKIHMEVKPHGCVFCEKRFADASALMRHERLHTGVKPYHCKYCGKRFSDGGQYGVHIKRHKRQRDFKCEYCDKAFYVLSDMKKHVSSVHFDAERKYVCDLCKRSFSSKYGLGFHMQVTHLDSKVKRKCKFCSGIFTECYMKSHVYKEHGVRKLYPVPRCTDDVPLEM